MAEEEREDQQEGAEGDEPEGAESEGANPEPEAESPEDAQVEEGARAAEPGTGEEEAAEASEPEAEGETAETPQPGAEEEEAAGEEDGKAPEQPPGAELEPIAIEADRELDAEERARREAEAEERARREAEATAETGEEEPSPRQAPAVKLESGARFTATGKRKSSIARVILVPGSGRVEINRREFDTYFPRPLHQTMARQPLVATGYDGNIDVKVRVHGGGISGQAGAVRHGIARALVEIDPELRGELKRRGFLTRDARRKERRKAGLKKARKRPQFSKR
jgi:small subunit ribosomal protein S9